MHPVLLRALVIGTLATFASTLAPEFSEAQGRFRETGVITAGDMVVWVRATERGEVHLYASKGFRDAFAKPVAIDPDAMEPWHATVARLAAVPRGEKDTTIPVAETGNVSLEWRNGRFVRGLVVNVQGSRGPLTVQMQETNSRDFMNALAEAARLTREMSPAQRPIATLATRREPPPEPANFATPAVSAAPPGPEAPQPARVAVLTVAKPLPARVEVTSPAVVPEAAAHEAAPEAAAPKAAAVPTTSPRPLAATQAAPASNVGGVFAQRADMPAVALNSGSATTTAASPESDRTVLTTKATITAPRVSTPGITRTESTPAAQISKLDASVSAVRSEFPGMVEMSDAGSGDAAAIGTFIRSRMHQLQFCYQEHGLKVNPDLAGTIGVAINVGEQGAIRNVAVTRSTWSGRGSAAVEGCLRERMGQWRLPLEDREQGSYSYVLVFSR